jgi:hypothetical protein
MSGRPSITDLLNASARGHPIDREQYSTRSAAPAFEESSGETIDLSYIIREKPKAKVVRQFLRENLAAIQGDDEVLFGGQ